MTSPDRRARAALVLATVAGASALSGCAAGQSSSFTGRTEAACRQAGTAIGAPFTPTVGREQMQRAIDRYGDIDRVVAQASSDIAFPGGSRGADLRRDWIDPARRSLRTARDELAALQRAVAAGDLPGSTARYRRAVVAGTDGVDTATLRSAGLVQCAVLFAATG